MLLINSQVFKTPRESNLTLRLSLKTIYKYIKRLAKIISIVLILNNIPASTMIKRYSETWTIKTQLETTTDIPQYLLRILMISK